LPIYGHLTGTYDYRLVALSIAIAIFAAYEAMDIASQVIIAKPSSKLAWLSGGSIAMGVGIWGMHYVGMLALRLPVSVLYDWPTVLLSIGAAIVASGVALFVVGRPKTSHRQTVIGGAIMGLGIASMHYIGMSAMRLQAMHIYSSFFVAVSIVLTVGISILGLKLGFFSKLTLENVSWNKCGSAVLLGLAISSMHYVAMAGTSFVPMPLITGSKTHAIEISSLGLAVICSIVFILIVSAMAMSAVSRQAAIYAEDRELSRTQAQATFDSLKEAIVVVDRAGSIVQINRAASELLGLKKIPILRSELDTAFDVFLPTGQLLPKEDWPSALTFRGEFLQSCELHIRRNDIGQISITDVSTTPILNRSGEIIQVVISYRDITQPREIDAARIKLAAIIESSEDAIIGKNAEGIIDSWNAGAEKIFGYTAEEMVGRSIRRLLPDDRPHEEDGILARIKRGETVDHIETIRKKKSGQFIHVSLSISPIRDSHGSVVGASKIARNITDRKNLENQLHQSQKMEAIGQLTGGIAHDFNNLLGIVIGNLDLLERQIKDDEAAHKRIQSARNAALRGADLTRHLLAFARQEELRPGVTNLQQAIQNVLVMASSALGSEIQVTTQFDPDVPSLFVDAAGLEMALLNLVVNARDAMPTGGKLTITSELRILKNDGFLGFSPDFKGGPFVCVSVSDTGCGMSSDIANKAFEPFFTTKAQGKGTGLGLAMVYGFFKQSGGMVKIYSEPGYGTTVTFYLPLAPNSSTSATAHSVDAPIHDPGGTVLIVDDEVELLEVGSSCLRDLGYQVLTAPNSENAIELLAAQPEIDMLLTDIIMSGGVNGVELAERASKNSPNLKIVYCSGFPANALLEKMSFVADRPLLRKPYQVSELISIVRKMLAETSEKAQ
jgi:PAS domain S-box-containing protein